MKNLKVVLSLLPVFALGCFIYFSATAYTPAKEVKLATDDKLITLNEKTSTTCLFRIIPNLDKDCDCTNMTVCIGSGAPFYVQSGTVFGVNVEEGTSVSVCVRCGTCSGMVTLTATPPCGVPNVNVYLTSSGGGCSCSE